MDECFTDRSIKTKTHNNTIKYIKKWILKDDDNIHTISVRKFSERLRSYRTNVTKKKLSYGSIKCLFYTMAKERATTWNFELMKKEKNKFWTKQTAFDALRSNDNLYDTSMTNKICAMILHFISILFSDQFYEQKLVHVGRAVALTVATNLRISEILQLRKKHIQQMVDGEIVNIRTKKKV